MNLNIQRLMPPLLVFAAAVYFGWPAAQSLLKEEPIVRATSVRWRSEDLDVPTKPHITKNPFQSVLVADETQEVEEETGKLIPATKPAGPNPNELTGGFRLTGIAQMGTVRWAILNGRPAKAGDLVETQNSYRHRCEVIEVHQDHILVKCEETMVKIEKVKKQSVMTSPSLGRASTVPTQPPLPI